MDGKLLECVVMALVCCVPLVKATNTNGTVNIFATIQDTGLRRWRNRRADTCRDIVHSFKDTQDISAQSGAKSGTTAVKAADATAWCLANTACTGYNVLSNNIVTYSAVKHTHIQKAHVTAYLVVLRCPAHHRCNKSPCKNGATCQDLSISGPGIKCLCAESWGGWYCEGKASCLDDPCGAGEKCSNSTTTRGFKCTANKMSTETKIAIAVGAAWALIVVVVACAAGVCAAKAAGTTPPPTYVRRPAK